MTTRTDFEEKFAKTGRNIDEMVEDVREEYREDRRKLKDKWGALDTRRAEYADKGDDAWDDVKDSMEEGWKDIEDSYDDIKRNFSSQEHDHTGHNH